MDAQDKNSIDFSYSCSSPETFLVMKSQEIQQLVNDIEYTTAPNKPNYERFQELMTELRTIALQQATSNKEPTNFAAQQFLRIYQLVNPLFDTIIRPSDRIQQSDIYLLELLARPPQKYIFNRYVNYLAQNAL